MNQTINIGNKDATLLFLTNLKNSKYQLTDIRLNNTHISDLNAVLGRKVFKNDVVFISSRTLWEVMQPIGGSGKHNYHGLTPENVYEAISTMRHSKNVTLSYDNRARLLAKFEIKY